MDRKIPWAWRVLFALYVVIALAVATLAFALVMKGLTK